MKTPKEKIVEMEKTIINHKMSDEAFRLAGYKEAISDVSVLIKRYSCQGAALITAKEVKEILEELK